jgi:hypothetical protein
MWTYPLLALQTLYKGIFTVGVEGGHDQFYFGTYTQDPGWTFYLVVLALKSSAYVLMGLIGYLFVYKKLDEKKKKFAVYSLAFAALYLIFLTLPSKKLDRYLIPSILSFILVTSFFYERFKNYILLLLLIPAIFILVRVHPDYFSYYNPLFGGLRTGINVIEPKWLIGEPEIINYFKNVIEQEKYVSFATGESFENLIDTNKLDNKLTVAFDEKYYTQIWPFIKDIGGWAIIQDLTPQSKEAKYFVYPVWDDYGKKETRFKIQYIDTIKIRGVPAYNVYKQIN